MNGNIFIIRILCSFFVLTFCLFILIKNRTSKVNQSFFILGISIFIWLFFFPLANIFKNEKTIEILLKICYAGVIFIPISFNSFISALLERKDSNKLYYYFFFLLYASSL